MRQRHQIKLQSGAEGSRVGTEENWLKKLLPPAQVKEEHIVETNWMAIATKDTATSLCHARRTDHGVAPCRRDKDGLLATPVPFVYRKPFVITLLTQQLFFQISPTEASTCRVIESSIMPRMISQVDSPSRLLGRRGLSSVKRQPINLSRLLWRTFEPGGPRVWTSSKLCIRNLTPQFCFAIHSAVQVMMYGAHLTTYSRRRRHISLYLMSRNNWQSAESVNRPNVVCICASNSVISVPRPKSMMTTTMTLTFSYCRE